MRSLRRSGTYFPVLRTLDVTHRLVLRWCSHLPLEDVLRIDRKWLFGRELRAGRTRRWRLMLATERLPQILVPCRLVDVTVRYAHLRAEEIKPYPKREDPIFDESNREPVTRASLQMEIERALSLIPSSAARYQPRSRSFGKSLCLVDSAFR